MKKVKYAVLAGVMAFGLTACGQSAEETTVASAASETTDTAAEETTEAKEETEAAAELSGSITMAGSTSMEKFANALAEAFMEIHPDVSVQAEFTGSSAGERYRKFFQKSG